MQKKILIGEIKHRNVESIVNDLKEKYNIIYDINRDFKNVEIIKNKTSEQQKLLINDLDKHILQLQKQKELKGRDIGRIIKAKEMLKNFKEMILHGEKN